MRPAFAGQIPEPQNGSACRKASVRLHHPAQAGREFGREGLAVAAQLVHGVLQNDRRVRLQPGSESKQGGSVAWHAAGLGQGSRHHGRLVGAAPKDQAMILAVDQALEPIQPRFQFSVLALNIGKDIGRLTTVHHHYGRRRHRESHRPAQGCKPYRLKGIKTRIRRARRHIHRRAG